MRQKVFTLILFLFALQVSHAQWKTEPPTPPETLECGVELQSSTWGEGNNMFGYNDCLPAGADPHNGFDRDYQFEIVGEITDVRFTFETNCIKSIFLLDANKACIDYTTLDPDQFANVGNGGLKIKKTFLGGIRLNPGIYHLIVDGPESSTCDAFSLLMECTPYVPFTICEFGGDISSCNATITDTLPTTDPVVEPEGPAFFAADFVECNPGESFNVYQAYFDNPGTVTAQLSNATPGTSVLIYSDACACISDILCFDGLDCPPGQFSNTGALAGASSGFYYFVVTGPSNAVYDLKIITNDCICDFEEAVEPIECDQTITADAATEANKFDNVPAQGLNAYENCYGRNRPYTGGDKVYQFEVFTRTKVTITLTSFFNAGLFLFDANCATDCLTYEESTGINGQAIIKDFEIQKGVYQIIVDLEEPHAASCPFTITLECETVPEADAFVLSQFITTNLIHNVFIPENLRFNRDDNQLGSDRNASIAYFANGRNCANAPVNDPVSIGGTPVDDPPHDLYGKLKGAPGDVYEIEAPFRLVLTADGKNQGFVEGSYAELENFEDGEASGLGIVSSLSAAPGLVKLIDVSSVDRTLSAAGGVVTFEIFANESTDVSGLDWCIAELDEVQQDADGRPLQKIDMLALNPKLSGQGKQVIEVVFGANDGTELRKSSIAVTGSTINRTVELILEQKGAINCEDNDDTAPVLTCDKTIEIPSNISSSVGRFLNFLKNEATGIIKDDCTDNEDLEIIVTPRDLSNNKVGETVMLSLEVKDKKGNRNSCNTLEVMITAPPTPSRGRQRNQITNEDIFKTNHPITIYPNPNNGTFNLSLQPLGVGQHELTIFNAFGKKVNNVFLNLDYSKQIIPIQMQDFAKGMYFIQLRLGNEIQSEKMIISSK